MPRALGNILFWVILFPYDLAA